MESQSGGKLESENQSQIKVKIKKDSKLDADYFITNINENYPLPEGVEISYEKGELPYKVFWEQRGHRW